MLWPRLELFESLGGGSGVATVGERRKNPSGTDRIDPDTVRSELKRRRAREIDNRGFSGLID